MGITKNLDKLGVFVLIIIAIAILSSGCTSKNEITPNETAVNVQVPTITPTPTATPTPEIPKVAKLKIMSVTAGQATLGGIPVTIKVKNEGDALAKDVYWGIIKISPSHPTSWYEYTDKVAIISRMVNMTILNGSSYIDTGYRYDKNNVRRDNLTVESTITKDYIGDIEAGETKTSDITVHDGDILVKVAWIDSTKEFTTY